MKRCVIIGGAPIADIKRHKSLLTDNDFYIFCDGGLRYASMLGADPDLIIGDFDSYERPKTDIETVVLPTAKDDTDTGFAVKEAVRRGFDEFLLIAVTGGRIDHTLGNISLLLYLDSLGKSACIADDLSDMSIVSSCTEVDKAYRWFSLIAVGGSACGVTIKGAKFPLENAVITPEDQYGISNEVAGDSAEITVADGRLLLVRVIEDVNKKTIDYWHYLC